MFMFPREFDNSEKLPLINSVVPLGFTEYKGIEQDWDLDLVLPLGNHTPRSVKTSIRIHFHPMSEILSVHIDY
jgi:hypothetical protein